MRGGVRQSEEVAGPESEVDDKSGMIDQDEGWSEFEENLDRDFSENMLNAEGGPQTDLLRKLIVATLEIVPSYTQSKVDIDAHAIGLDPVSSVPVMIEIEMKGFIAPTERSRNVLAFPVDVLCGDAGWTSHDHAEPETPFLGRFGTRHQEEKGEYEKQAAHPHIPLSWDSRRFYRLRWGRN